MNLERLVQVMTALSDATSLSIIWKSGVNMLVETALPLRHRFHTHPLCEKVKTTHEDACLHNDNIFISGLAVQKRQYFVHSCHAGVLELVIPIFHGDSYCGTIMVGPFRSGNGVSPYPQCTVLLQDLPELSDKKCRAMVELVEMLILPFSGELAAGHAENLLPPDELLDHEGVRHAVGIIRQKFRRRLSVNQLSRECGLSISHFQHVFKQQTQLSMLEYLQRIRVMEAQRLIGLTDLSLSDIAAICGFGDQSRMAVLFRRYLNRNPSSYRRRKCRENS